MITFRSAWAGEASYEVYGYGRISHRFAPGSDYFKSIYNGPPEEYERDVVGKTLFVSKYCGKITEEVFQIFYAYLEKKWEEWLIYCDSKKKKFADEPDIRVLYERYGPACPLVYPAYWNNGWHQLDYRRKP